MALAVTLGAGSISLVTGLAVGLGPFVGLVTAVVAASLGGSAVVLVWLLRKDALVRRGYRW
jgi:hypothetical protein